MTRNWPRFPARPISSRSKPYDIYTHKIVHNAGIVPSPVHGISLLLARTSALVKSPYELCQGQAWARVRHGTGVALCTYLHPFCVTITTLIRPFCITIITPFRPLRRFCPSSILLLLFLHVPHHLCERHSNSTTLFRFIVTLLRHSHLLHFRFLRICGVIDLSFLCDASFLRFEHHCVLPSQGPHIVMGSHIVPSMSLCQRCWPISSASAVGQVETNGRNAVGQV